MRVRNILKSTMSKVMTLMLACTGFSAAAVNLLMVESNREADRGATSSGLTTIEESQSLADSQMAGKIRDALLADQTISHKAKGVRIHVRDQRVTLSGSVKSTEERTAVEEQAKLIAGNDRVKSELEVESD